ncbi:hypothetical protein BJ508DRAFT_371939 [Ascobolus immersus RN42]|uniref:t-SNARE coiled-coil homology domain-containing protein n=1 Tax=Ascobolus immersus RN42 TaxID=1160509 RepID=A0A3N4ITQ4_ASCIM|nr:hypothetical protein BJ508DRAFT_371939 [Ascobolus immersus RN42]
MARPMPASPSTVAATNLTRLLSRLSQRLGATSPTTSPNPSLSTLSLSSSTTSLSSLNSLTSAPITPFELQKLHQNLEHAKSLLAQLEKGISAQADGLRLREDCVRWRGSVRDLEEKLWVLEEQEKKERAELLEEDEDEDESDEEVEEPTRPTVSIPESQHQSVAPPVETKPEPEPQPTQTTTMTSQLRNRNKAPATTSKTGLAITPAAILEAQQSEQDALTAELVKMAQALKQSSIQFGQDLEDEKPLLEQAVEGLDKNMMGMEMTGGKMKVLKKDQSLGFLRTMINMAVCVALMLAILLVLSLPKLRF